LASENSVGFDYGPRVRLPVEVEGNPDVEILARPMVDSQANRFQMHIVACRDLESGSNIVVARRTTEVYHLTIGARFLSRFKIQFVDPLR
jgi:hypothetical protein